jgi:predicted ribosome quality control (RQC) complex YloA/Tae2 family protein
MPIAMPRSERRAPLPPDPEMGLWQGRSVARRFVSPDGMTVLVGRTAEDNDVLSLKLGAPRDFWFHVAGESGSHVIVRNPEGLDRLPKETERFAASLAAGYSKARKGGRVAVHLCTCADVSKPRGLPPGKVVLERFRSLQVTPWRPDG